LFKRESDAQKYLDGIISDFEKDPKIYYLQMLILKDKSTSFDEYKRIYELAINHSLKQVYQSKDQFDWALKLIDTIAEFGYTKEANFILNDLVRNQIVKKFRSKTLNLRIKLAIKIDSNEIITELESILDDYGEIDLSEDCIKASIIQISSFGDQKSNQFDWNAALKLYEFASQLFSSNLEDSRNNAILCRKMSLCCVRLAFVDKALEYCIQAVGLDNRNNCKNSYLFFIIYLEMGQIEQAIENINKIDFEQFPEYYLAAADTAYKKDYKKIVYQIMKSIAQNLNVSSITTSQISSFLLVMRSLVQNTFEEIQKQVEESLKTLFLNELFGYFSKRNSKFKKL
jgi:tetratricopeptide (TPR) repeat protein